MLNMDGFVKLTVGDVVWLTDDDGEPYWKPKNPEPGKSYCLVLPPINTSPFQSVPLFETFGKRCGAEYDGRRCGKRLGHDGTCI